MPVLSYLTKTLLCLVLGAGLATAAYAAEENNDRPFSEAWEDAIGDQEPILTEKQFALFNNLAFQAAASKVCDGFALNHDKFTAGIAEAASPPPPDLSEEEADHWEAAVLIRFGTSYGLLLAEGNEDEEDFCTSAAEMMADSGVPNVWQ